MTVFPVEIHDDRLIVSFPLLNGEEAELVPVQVVFDVPILRFGTQFAGWVYSSEVTDQIKQPVEPGNSTLRFSGDVLSVGGPIGGNLLVEVEASPNPFTPNDDGVNDRLNLSFSLREVTVDREVSLALYDLSGRRVRKVTGPGYRSGEHLHSWDGLDDAGRTVPPGIYIYRLELSADTDEQHSGTVAVAY